MYWRLEGSSGRRKELVWARETVFYSAKRARRSWLIRLC